MNINSQNVSKAEEALQLAYKDLISFGKLFLPDDFMRSETPFFHYEIGDAIDDKNVKQEYILYDMSSKTYYDILRIRKIIDMLPVPEKMETT